MNHYSAQCQSLADTSPSVNRSLTWNVSQFSKAGLNGLTAHLQTGENKRIASGAPAASAPLIRFYAVAPGVLKTAFTGFQVGKPPQLGAQVVMQLLGDEEGTYPGGTQWQFENGEMMQVPW